jgi:ATP-dependent DNA helicase RecG
MPFPFLTSRRLLEDAADSLRVPSLPDRLISFLLQFQADGPQRVSLTVELAGTGIRRMKEATAQAGLPPPKIRQTNFFTTTFKRLTSEDLERIFSSGAVPTKHVSETPGAGVEKGVEKLSPNERTLYDLIRNNPSISKAAMSAKGNLTKKSVEYNLVKLKTNGLIRHVGPDRGGYWEVVDRE